MATGATAAASVAPPVTAVAAAVMTAAASVAPGVTAVAAAVMTAAASVAPAAAAAAAGINKDYKNSDVTEGNNDESFASSICKMCWGGVRGSNLL